MNKYLLAVIAVIALLAVPAVRALDMLDATVISTNGVVYPATNTVATVAPPKIGRAHV